MSSFKAHTQIIVLKVQKLGVWSYSRAVYISFIRLAINIREKLMVKFAEEVSITKDARELKLLQAGEIPSTLPHRIEIIPVCIEQQYFSQEHSSLQIGVLLHNAWTLK